MSRLYDITYNEDQWAIKGSRDDGYKIVNKTNFDSFRLAGDIIGIEQILDDTFLVYRRIERYRWQIYRVKFAGNTAISEFKENFEHFKFLTDDTILFDSRKIYSISQNAEVHTADNFLRLSEIEVADALDGRRVMIVKRRIIENHVPDLFVMVIIDAGTFKPVTQAFSLLRNKLITLTDDLTFEELVSEDEYYAREIGKRLFEENLRTSKNGKATLLSQCPLKKD